MKLNQNNSEMKTTESVESPAQHATSAAEAVVTTAQPADMIGSLGDRGTPEPKLMQNASIMMIDDEPIMIDLVRAFLDEAGYREFVGISKPTLAIERMHAERPDVLLLDLFMPKVSGFDILEQVRADSTLKFTPVIVMTSASDAATKLKVLELGATDFLEKPVDPSELALRLRNTLAFKAYRDRSAFFDALTGLPNRRLFLNQLATAVRRAQRTATFCALLSIDLDRFKQVNETLGHRAGDTLLKAVADRLQGIVRGTDAIGRLTEQSTAWSISRVGGDDFTALLPDLKRIEDVEIVARRVLAVMARPFHIDGHELFITPSIGISICPIDAIEPEGLLKQADVALTHAKQRGRNNYSFYSVGINAKALDRLTLQNQLRRGIERQEFVLHYQPKIDVASGKIVGAEALIRWQHPERGLLSPDKFIQIAEETNLIVEIGRWVLFEATRQAKEWLNLGIAQCPVSVNVSSPQLRDRRLQRDVDEALKASGLPAKLLTIELTESILMDSIDEVMDQLSVLAATGVSLSLDDFGTGYSSMAYLKQMPLAELKIDRSFIRELPTDSPSIAIISAVIALAHGLGLSVIAEGVETIEQLAFLKSKGCNAYQGFLASKAVPADQFVEMLTV
jgi:diguanylate cyclase